MHLIFPLIPFLFFLIAMYFRAKENSITLFEEHNIPQEKKYQFAIPISKLKEVIANTNDNKIREELKKCLNNRKYFWYSLALIFLSILIPSIVKGIILSIN